MSLLQFFTARFKKIGSPRLTETDPEQAYDLWAASYDVQPDNLMLALDHQLFVGFLADTVVTDKTVIDIGCGTGRHWKELLKRQPGKLTGYDVSVEMLQVLKQKFPGQQVFRLIDNTLAEPDGSSDIIISTLALAHIADPAEAIAEWARVIKPGGELIVTDYHPDALAKGGNRTFRHKGQLVAVKNFVHSISRIKSIAKQLGLSVLRMEERKVDETVKVYYEKQGALAVYENFKGVPIIYGIHLKKDNAVT